MLTGNQRPTDRRRFYWTSGTMGSDAPSYVERAADRELYEALNQGEYCYVLTSRQIGKSSLMVRTAARLREQGTKVVVLDLTAIGANLTPEQWYDSLLAMVGLGVEEELEAFWLGHERLGPLRRWIQAVREVVLAKYAGPVVVFIDEIDAVRNLPFSTDEFFAAIRECFNRRTEDPAFQRLTFCLIGVATPSDLIQDARTTPFNIGRRIELTDFTAAEAAPLAEGLAGGDGPLFAGKRERERNLMRNPGIQEEVIPFLVSWISYRTVGFRAFALSRFPAKKKASHKPKEPGSRLAAECFSGSCIGRAVILTSRSASARRQQTMPR